MLVPVLLIIVGFVLLIKGADFLVDGSSAIAKKFHIPEIVIGLTIVSIGTSLPEMTMTVVAAKKEEFDIEELCVKKTEETNGDEQETWKLISGIVCNVIGTPTNGSNIIQKVTATI